jgi:hypothetical protein
MTGRVNVRRLADIGAQDEETGLESGTWSIVLKGVPFRLNGGATEAVNIGGVDFAEATALAELPADTEDLDSGDLLEVTAGPHTGTVWQIIEAVRSDQQTSRRLPISEVTRPSEWSTP